MKRYIAEIESSFSSLPKRKSAHHPESYIGGGQSKLRYIGLKVPDMRRVYDAGFSFSDKQPSEVAKIWDYVWWNSDCYEVMSLALTWFDDPKQRKNSATHWPVLKKWSERIDNWAHSDTLSGIYARIYEGAPKEIFKTFKQWSRAKNPWLRRLSIVSLFYYAQQRERYPSFERVISLVKPQLAFDHYYVQKGVGWTLRETGNVYPKQTFKFVEENVHQISAAAFSATTEKMSAAQRERLKRLRSHRNRHNHVAK